MVPQHCLVSEHVVLSALLPLTAADLSMPSPSSLSSLSSLGSCLLQAPQAADLDLIFTSLAEVRSELVDQDVRNNCPSGAGKWNAWAEQRLLRSRRPSLVPRRV